ncbi:MAG: quinone-dependent dihydroorotate dehydrogenase [Rhizobiaceae bacterium]|nr:quinone-dependent dihydroorotate dehydrogenase [Rhizobiaceae bacterium]
MSGTFGRLATAALRCVDPETAHTLSINALKTGMVPGTRRTGDPKLAVNVAGLRFPNPLGMAAGYDKNGEVPDALLALGFGFSEIGTVTPLPQLGNPRPRIFRLERDGAIVNRLGFNNGGHDAMLGRLAARRTRGGIVGVNIGANKDSADRIGDYVLGAARFSPLASYLTVNISSPNTPGLRNLQSRASLAELLVRVRGARDSSGATPPIFLKIAPDLSEAELSEIAEEVLVKRIEGLIVSNTTLSRAGATGPSAQQAGGLSGRPLFARSTAVLARMRKLAGPKLAIIGVGGVSSAEDAAAKIEAGADLVQLYSAMVYAGPGLPGEIVAGLSRIVAARGLGSIAQLRDRAVDEWAQRPIG